MKTFNDTTAPKLVGTNLNSSNQLVLVFDEPVSSVGTVKIDDVTVADSSDDLTYSVVAGQYTATVNTAIAESLRALGSHTVVAYDVKM